MTVTLAQLRDSLDAHALDYGVMPLTGGITLLVTQRGGRIFAFDSKGTPLYWINPALGNKSTLAGFLNDGAWNLGGERIWIAPEIQYIIHDRNDFWGTHRLPASIDPGNYTLTQNGDGWSLAQTLTLQAYNTAQGETTLSVQREIREIANPLRQLATFDALMHGVAFSGYQHTVTLSDERDATLCSESWNLVQLLPDGMLYIPVTAQPEVTPYFGNPLPDALTAEDGAIRIHITGKQQYKTGYKAAMMTGTMAYLRGNALLVRVFENNPSSVYAEEPPLDAGNRGHSVHVYNDGGELGGFGEMEASGQTIGGESGRATSTDTFRMWIFTGEPAQLKQIGALLLGRTL